MGNPLDTALSPSKKEIENAGKQVLINHIFPDEINTWSYEESGKPYFDHRTEALSFSHSGDVFACQISNKIACGIDVQHYREKITRVAEKYLNEKELEFVSSIPEIDQIKILTAMWSCKEALYKMYGKGFIDYINRFTIQPFKPISGIVVATADFGNGWQDYHFHIEFTDTFVLAFHTLSPLLPANDSKRIFDI
jgi:phosphopantetheinyl transferase